MVGREFEHLRQVGAYFFCGYARVQFIGEGDDGIAVFYG